MANGGRINVLFNDEDYKIIKFLADERGLPAASFVRMLTLSSLYESGKDSYLRQRDAEERDAEERRIRTIEEFSDAYYRSLEP